MPDVRRQGDHRVSALLLGVPRELDRQLLHGRLDANHHGAPSGCRADHDLGSAHPLLFREQVELRRELRPHQTVSARAHAEAHLALEVLSVHLVVRFEGRLKDGKDSAKGFLLGWSGRFEDRGYWHPREQG